MAKRLGGLRFSVMVGVVLLGVAASGVAVGADPKYDAAKKEGKVVWYVSMFDVDTAEQVRKAFEAKYPGVHVDVVRATAGVIYQRVLQESQAGVYPNDVFSSTEEGHYVGLKGKGLLEQYVPVDANKVIKRFQGLDPENYYQVASVGLILITHNSEKVPPGTAPKTWKEFLDPKWKGKISIGHPAFSGYVATWVLAVTKLYGWQYFEALAKQNPQIGRSIIDTVTMLNAGERMVAAGPDFITLKSKNKGNPVDLVYPEDGSVLMTAPSAIMKRGPHPNAAKLFMDFVMSVEYSQVLAKNGGAPLRPEVTPPKGLRPLTDVKLLRPTLEEIKTGIPAIIEKFRSTFGV
ncbi:MAG: extracellular solute-binding protein [Candidatus Rokubacteria bacterium]|nr:extracellular solute-binding protein [Candidatus Rokubacteria bacterium]